MRKQGPENVAVCYLHSAETVSTTFHHSLLALCMRDITSSRQMFNMFPGYCGTMGLPESRNTATRTALDAGAEWVFWLDSDMGFASDTLDRLVAVADPVSRPIVGALAFAQLYEHGDEGYWPESVILPTLYSYVPGKAMFERWSDWPRNEIVEVDATGAACMLVHRRVFETIAEDGKSDCWFTPIQHPTKTEQLFGEDVSFCLRARGNGFPVAVDTSVKTSHHKPRWLTERIFDNEALTIPNFAVIPTIGRKGYVKDLVFELAKQGETARVFVLDNGCPDKIVHWLDNHDLVERIPMPDANIHEMWNAGLQAAQKVCMRSNVAILNDDIMIGDRFMAGLGAALRARWDIGVVGPNYDNRDGDGVMPVAQVCAGRYDGTGGLPGFAFMVRGESCYLFPQELHWWYGDNDMILHHLVRDRVVGIVADVSVTHIDGGGQTGDWDSDEMAPLLEADRKTFESMWGEVLTKNG